MPDQSDQVAIVYYYSFTDWHYNLTEDRWSIYDTQFNESTRNIEVYKSIHITKDLNYAVFLAGNKIEKCSLFSYRLNNIDCLKKVLDVLKKSSICNGNDNIKFQCLTEARKGTLNNRSGKFFWHNYS